MSLVVGILFVCLFVVVFYLFAVVVVFLFYFPFLVEGGGPVGWVRGWFDDWLFLLLFSAVLFLLLPNNRTMASVQCIDAF